VVQHASSLDAVLIERQEQLDSICVQARDEGRFAFDTEFVMEDRYEPEVCLVQIAVEKAVAIIDPLGGLDLQAVWELVSDEGVEKIVHAGQEDLAVCFRETGKIPRRIFDVQIAAALVGLEYPLSLQKLVHAVLHVRLHKSKTLTDWRKRPLSGSQLRYAAEDVSYLLAVHRKLRSRLESRGRLAWAEEEFRGFEDQALYVRAEEDKLRRVKGVSVLKGQQLAVARKLLQWRDDLARHMNRPARVIMKDHLLVEVARHGVSSFAELRDLRGLNMSDKNINALAHMVREALAAPVEVEPSQRTYDTESPQETALITLLTAVVRGYCLENDLAYGLVATKKGIQDLIRHRTIGRPANAADVELLGGWRGQTVGAMLDEVLAGSREIHVATVDGEPAIRVGPRVQIQIGGGQSPAR
jgi:ribonuclease D